MYSYKIYGLNISSEVEIPELPETAGESDITFRMGKHADAPSGNYTPGAHRLSPEVMLFTAREAGSFLIEGKRKVTVFPVESCDPAMLRLFLLGSVSGMILHLNDFLPLHGNAVALDGEGCVAFLGHSGKGKSTLAAMLMKRGYKLLTDDICAVRTANGMPMVMPGIPHVRLWGDAMQMLQIDPSGLKKHHPSEEKFLLPIGKCYAKHPLPLKKIYILGGAGSEDECRLELLSPSERMRCLRNHTYRLGFVKRTGQSRKHFSLCGEVAARVPVKMIMRPQANLPLEQFVDFVERDLHSSPTAVDAP